MGKFGQQFSDLCPQFSPVDNHVNRAMIKQKLTSLKAFRQLFPDGLFDYTRTSKTDQRFRFANIDVAQHRETG